MFVVIVKIGHLAIVAKVLVIFLVVIVMVDVVCTTTCYLFILNNTTIINLYIYKDLSIQIRNNPAERLLPGQFLSIGKYILSKNGKYSAEMQNDGNFLVYVI